MSKQNQQTISAAKIPTPLQPQQVSIEQALRLAGQQIDAGQLQVAETVLHKILDSQPGNAFATHLLGVIAHRMGRTELAVELIGKAIETQPSVAAFHTNRGEMCRILKRLDEAIYHGEQAVKLDPNLSIAHSNLGIAHYDKKNYELAEACQKKALELDPAKIKALNNLGSIRRELHDLKGAVAYFRRALEIAPDYVESRNNLGAALAEMDKPGEAVTELLEVIRAQPRNADAYCNIGNAYLYLSDYDKALDAYNHVLALNADNPRALVGLARTHKEIEQLDEASSAVCRALALDPDKAEIHDLSGDIYLKMGLYEQAEAAYNKAHELDENLIGAHLGIGRLHMELGRLDKAESCFKKAMEIAPEAITPYTQMVHIKKTKPGDPILKRLESEIGHLDTIPPSKAMPLHFALGKAYDDLDEYDKAFPYFAAGCRIKRGQITYDAGYQDQIFQNIHDFFSKERIDRLRGGGAPSGLPIFVLGMPRSGTTLTETIIASHPDVMGGGELRYVLELANHPVAGMKSEGYPLTMPELTEEDMTRMGERYVADLRKHSATAKHITDKMPANFLALGLIHLMLPNAKIIHVKRNAADACLSCFTKQFGSGLHYSYDLTEMGRYYVNFAKLMEYWRKVLPQDAFYEVQYEELVADTEAQTRRLIEYCGLGWNDACLESHKSERAVKTASITQVRQPIYTTSVERWCSYEKHLQPLFQALGEYAPVR